MSAKCHHHELSRSSRAVRGGICSAPTIGVRDEPGRLVIVLLYHIRPRRFISGSHAAARFALLDHVRQQAEEARALDRLRELALLFRRNGGDAARYDFAALGDVTLQELHVLVVDLRARWRRRTDRSCAGERRDGARRLAMRMPWSIPPRRRCHRRRRHRRRRRRRRRRPHPAAAAPRGHRGHRGRDRICASSPTVHLRALRRGL